MISSHFRRALAVLLLLCVTSEPVLADLSQASVWSERRASRSSDKPVTLASLPLSLPALPRTVAADRTVVPEKLPASPLRTIADALPADRVAITRVSVGATNRAPIILLQDIHLLPEAQKNLGAAVTALIDRGAGRILLEGGFGPLDLTRFRAFPQALRGDLGLALLECNRIGGPSLAAIVSDRGIPDIEGADDEALYRENVAAVIESARARTAAATTLAADVREIAARKAGYNPRLKSFDLLLTAHRAGTISLGEFTDRVTALRATDDPDIHRFLTAYHLERTMNVARVEAERRAVLERLAPRLADADVKRLLDDTIAYRAGRMSFSDFHDGLKRLCAAHSIDLAASPAFADYLRYVALSEAIDAASLIEKIDAFAAATGRSLAANDSEGSLIEEDRMAALAGRLLKFELTPAEWTAWRKGPRDARPAGIDFTPFETFYAAADERSEIMVKKALASNGHAAVALVVGGFHTPALERKLRAAGAPFIIASPRVTAAGSDPTAYLSVFTREKTPLERIFAGEKLSVNPAGVVLGGRNPESVQSGSEFLTRAGALMAAAGAVIPAAAGVTATPAAPNVYDVDGVLIATGKTTTAFETVPGSTVNGTTVVVRRKNVLSRMINAARSAKAAAVAAATDRNAAYTPGIWAVFWRAPMRLSYKYLGETLTNKLRPAVTGIGEGMITALLAYFGGDLVALTLWIVITFSLHYAMGVVWWNPDTQSWDIRRYGEIEGPDSGPLKDNELSLLGYRFRPTDAYYLRANLAAATGLLGFVGAALGGGFVLIAVLSVVPHVFANLSKELRVDERRRRATSEKTRKFRETGEIAGLADAEKAPENDGVTRLLDQLESGNDLASFARFTQSGSGNYRLAMIMQPGSTSGNEGPGFKKFNDSIGYDLMNRVWRYRNDQLWDIVQRDFADISAKAGRPVLTLIAGNFKSIRFAIDMDAIEAIYPNADQRRSIVTERLNDSIREANLKMVDFMTREGAGGPSISNADVVAAVRIAQGKGKLPRKIETYPLYWGLSNEAERRSTLDSVLAADAQALAAINMARAGRREVRRLGSEFNQRDLRDTLELINTQRRRLTALNVLDPQTGTIPAALADSYRKKTPEQVKKYLSDRVAAEDLDEAYDRLSQYVGLLLAFDFVKPWVGSREKPESMALAVATNAVMRQLSDLKAETDPGERQSRWNGLQPALQRVLSADVRAPFLGSTFEFYGRSESSGEQAVLFVDFRGFGAIIMNELEATAQRLLTVAQKDEGALNDAFGREMLTLGDNSLDPFAGALRGIRANLEKRFPGAKMTFYFGGDDVSVLLPKNLVYDATGDRPSTALIDDVFSEIPAGMRVRVVLASTTPFKEREDGNLKLALTLTGVDELAEDAKKAEESWMVRGAKVEEVVAFTDHVGARWRLPMFSHQPGRPEMEHPGHEDNVTYIVKEIMRFYQRYINREADAAAARHWAETKVEESMVLFGAIVAFIELPLLPGVPILFANFLGGTGAIIVGAIAMTLFHELTFFVSWVRNLFREHILKKPLRRKGPPGPWLEWLPVRAGVRFLVSVGILTLSFLPLSEVLAAGYVPLDSFMFLLPTFLIAWLTHAVWNAFAPPAWRLSLFRYPGAAAVTRASTNRSGENQNQDFPAGLDEPRLGLRFRAALDGYGGDVVGRDASHVAAAAATEWLRTEFSRIKDPSDLSVPKLSAILARASEAANTAVLGLGTTGRSTGSLSLFWGRNVLVSQAGDTSALLVQWPKDRKKDPNGVTAILNLTLHNLKRGDAEWGELRYDSLTTTEPSYAFIDRNKPLPKPLQTIEDLQRGVAGLTSPIGADLITFASYIERNIVGNTLGEGDDYFPVIYHYEVPEDSDASLFLLSDGIADNLTEMEIFSIIASAPDVEAAATTLVEASRRRMAMVDAAREPLRRILKRYDDLEFLPPGSLGDPETRAVVDQFINEGKRAPKFRLIGQVLISYFQMFRQDLFTVQPVDPEVEAAFNELRNVVYGDYFLRAKIDDALAMGAAVTNDGKLPMASILDRWLLARVSPSSAIYALYTTVLANWELVFFLPVAFFAAQGGSSSWTIATALAPLSAAVFAAFHFDHTAAEKRAVFGVGLALGGALLLATWLGAGSLALLAPAVLHGLYNGMNLRRLRTERALVDAFSDVVTRRSAADLMRRQLIDLAASLPVTLGVANLDRPQWSTVSTTLSDQIDRWRKDGVVTRREAAQIGEDTATALRRAVTGRDETGLTLGSEDAIYAQAARIDEAPDTAAETFVYRFISARTPEQAATQALASVRTAKRRLGDGRGALVVEGEASVAAVKAALEKNGLAADVLVIAWTPDMTMRALQGATAEWLADRGLMSSAAARRAMLTANFRLMLPDPGSSAFALPSGFLAGMDDITRFRVFIVIESVLLAVEVSPLHLEQAQEIARLVAQQA